MPSHLISKLILTAFGFALIFSILSNIVKANEVSNFGFKSETQEGPQDPAIFRTIIHPITQLPVLLRYVSTNNSLHYHQYEVANKLATPPTSTTCTTYPQLCQVHFDPI